MYGRHGYDRDYLNLEKITVLLATREPKEEKLLH
jgi:hypothetical protein